MTVGRLLSFWDGLFSGAMLNFQGVDTFFVIRLQKDPGVVFCWANSFQASCGKRTFLEEKISLQR